MMNFRYGTSFQGEVPEAYETLLLDAMLGDPTLFARHDFVEASWALITPINELWQTESAAAADLRGGRMGTAGSRRADRKGWPPMENAVTAQPPGRARTATVVAVGPSDRLGRRRRDPARRGRCRRAAHRQDRRRRRRRGRRRRIGRMWSRSAALRPEYVNNAIAAVRLSSLPTIVWWRGGRPEGLDGVASLADRVVLDADDPLAALGADAAALRAHRAHRHPLGAAHPLARGARALLRSARRARAPRTRSPACRSPRRIRPRPRCSPAGSTPSLGWRGRIARGRHGRRQRRAARIGDAGERVVPHRAAPAAQQHLPVDGGPRRLRTVVASRVVSLGDQTLSTLLAEELRVRSRDIAFERALREGA